MVHFFSKWFLWVCISSLFVNDNVEENEKLALEFQLLRFLCQFIQGCGCSIFLTKRKVMGDSNCERNMENEIQVIDISDDKNEDSHNSVENEEDWEIISECDIPGDDSGCNFGGELTDEEILEEIDSQEALNSVYIKDEDTSGKQGLQFNKF